MRLMQRRNVDLPQPDGPMNAVTAFDRMSTVMPVSALKSPYQKLEVLDVDLGRPAVDGRSLRCSSVDALIVYTFR